ncbi:MAG: hypothetical protein KGL39_48750 [Patescibacteria group bacterium]|nr:hypothetical protein [Patescibacteria group bacterium]
MSASILRPCPHCGSSTAPTVFDASVTDEMSANVQWRVVCNNSRGGCGSSSAYTYRPRDAVAVWNSVDGRPAPVLPFEPVVFGLNDVRNA